MKVKTEIVTLFDKTKPFQLESGSELSPVQVAYQTYGKLNSEGTNAILICHALTGNAHAAGILAEEEYDIRSNPDLLNKYSILNKGKPGWWDELIGEGKLFDTNKYFIISSNILGSCYGTTGPVSIKNIFNRSYGMNFPTVTVRDMVKLQKTLIDHLNVKKLATVAGGSLGGMQVLEWAIMYPEIVNSIIPIATSAQHSPWAISLNEASRRAIKNDPKWMNGNYKTQPHDGLALARKIAMISYRSMESFEQKFSRERKDENSSRLDTENIFQIESYLNHHGDKLNQRFDANTYIYLSHAMDLHDVALNRGSLEEILGSINAPTLSLGISSDILYPPDEQKKIASLIPNAEYAELNSIHGHDGFLIEFDQMTEIIGKFLSEHNL
ncbi:Homoserine O-acetyltransferase [hydrothermal vent metagenome]|uniref:Homoserine O-acetyltransferase n=1 Tax=hydrothermal vent metagenome TaxID=652676 RepID=A0A3B1D173_9ZZZZ